MLVWIRVLLERLANPKVHEETFSILCGYCNPSAVDSPYICPQHQAAIAADLRGVTDALFTRPVVVDPADNREPDF